MKPEHPRNEERCCGEKACIHRTSGGGEPSRDAHELLAQAPNKRGPKARPEQAELSRLERENVTLRKQLAQARALLDLQKKATLLMDLLTLSPGNEEH